MRPPPHTPGPQPVPWVGELMPAVHGAVTDEGVLDFSANGNVIGPSPAVAAALQAVDLSRYPDPASVELRAAIAGREGVAATEVVVGNGSTELIWGIARAYLTLGRSALMVGPTYGEYAVASRATGASVLSEPERIAREPGGPLPEVDPQALRDAISRIQPSLVWICHPNNPTGRLFCIDALAELSEASPTSIFVIDEAYLGLTDGGQSAVALRASGRVVVLRSLTKDLGLAGLRLGYAVAAPNVADLLARALPPWNVNALAQAGGVAALADVEHQSRARQAVAASRAHLIDGLVRLGLEPCPTVANFVLVAVGSAEGIAGALRERGLAVRDCTSFGLPDCIRIGVRSVPDQERLLAALGEVVHG